DMKGAPYFSANDGYEICGFFLEENSDPKDNNEDSTDLKNKKESKNDLQNLVSICERCYISSFSSYFRIERNDELDISTIQSINLDIIDSNDLIESSIVSSIVKQWDEECKRCKSCYDRLTESIALNSMHEECAKCIVAAVTCGTVCVINGAACTGCLAL
ncbi:39013_t:CDS:2, partial [Gigaspora margarita]